MDPKIITLPDPIDLVREAFSRYTQFFSRMFPVLVVIYLTSALTIFTRFVHQPIVAGIIVLIGGIISLIAYIAVARILCEVQTDAADLTGNFKKSLKLFLPYIWISILNVTAVAGGAVLFIIPGVIISLYVFLSLFVFIVEDKRGLKALLGSFEYVHGRWWQVVWRMFVYLIFLICLSFIISIFFTLIMGNSYMPQAQIPLGVNLLQQLIQAFVFLPLSLAYSFCLYKALRITTSGTTTDKTKKRARISFITFSIIGAIIIPLFIIIVVGASIVVALNHGDTTTAMQGLGPFQTFFNLL